MLPCEAQTTKKENRRGGCATEAVEVRPRPNANEVDANLRVDVRRLQDNQMWIADRSTYSPSSYSDDSSDPSKRRRNKKPSTSSGGHQKSPWKDAEMKRKCRVARYEFYASRARLQSSLQAAIRLFKP